MNLRKSLDILGLDPATDPEAAKRAYKAMVRRWHPDQFPERSPTKAQAEERLKQINIAYARVKEHLARIAQSPVTDARENEASAAAPRESTATHHRTDTRRNTTKRSWFEHLFDILNAFDAGPAEKGPSTDAGTSSRANRRKSFQQVLGEMAGGKLTANPKPARRRPMPSMRLRSGSRGASRRSSGAVDAVDGTERVGPVRPVSRVRGIGKNR